MATTSNIDTGYANLSPVFGDELDSYKALLYGINTIPESGIPAGLFWDLRSMPLPYQPLKPTVFRADVYDNNVGKLHRIKFIRENPTVVPTSDYFDFVPETSSSNLQLYLGRGLNVLDMYVLDAGIETRIFTCQYTTAVFANILHGHATMTTRYGWRPLKDLRSSLLGPRSTGLLEPLLGGMSDLFVTPTLLGTLAKQLVINVLTYGSDNHGVVDLGSAFYQQTPLLQQVNALAYEELLQYQHIAPLSSYSSQWNQRRYHTWALNAKQAKRALVPRYLQNNNRLVDAGPNTLVTKSGVLHLFDDYTPELESVTEEWSLFIVSTLPMDINVHTRHYDEVMFPGLWDSGVLPYFDTPKPLDSGTFDSADVSGDIVLDGFIGTMLFNEQSTDVGVTLLDRAVETLDVFVGLHTSAELMEE